MWGQATIIIGGFALLGIIPTRVGTSVNKDNDKIDVKDHPHACGDKSAE